MVSFVYDDYIKDLDTTIWIANLSDGSIVYQDDGRNGLKDSAWLRLKQYCDEKGLFVAQMSIRFRSNSVKLPPSSVGYFFRKGLLASPALKKNIQQFVIGPIVGRKIDVHIFRVPELILEEREVRNVKDFKDSIICKTRRKPTLS